MFEIFQALELVEFLQLILKDAFSTSFPRNYLRHTTWRDTILFPKREEKDEIEKLESPLIMALMKVVLQVVISS